MKGASYAHVCECVWEAHEPLPAQTSMPSALLLTLLQYGQLAERMGEGSCFGQCCCYMYARLLHLVIYYAG